MAFAAKAVVLTWGDFGPQGHLVMPGDIFDDHNWGMLLESRGQKQEMLLKNPTMHRTAPHSKK